MVGITRSKVIWSDCNFLLPLGMELVQFPKDLPFFCGLVLAISESWFKTFSVFKNTRFFGVSIRSTQRQVLTLIGIHPVIEMTGNFRSLEKKRELLRRIPKSNPPKVRWKRNSGNTRKGKYSSHLPQVPPRNKKLVRCHVRSFFPHGSNFVDPMHV